MSFKRYFGDRLISEFTQLLRSFYNVLVNKRNTNQLDIDLIDTGLANGEKSLLTKVKQLESYRKMKNQ